MISQLTDRPRSAFLEPPVRAIAVPAASRNSARISLDRLACNTYVTHLDDLAPHDLQQLETYTWPRDRWTSRTPGSPGPRTIHWALKLAQ